MIKLSNHHVLDCKVFNAYHACCAGDDTLQQSPENEFLHMTVGIALQTWVDILPPMFLAKKMVVYLSLLMIERRSISTRTEVTAPEHFGLLFVHQPAWLSFKTLPSMLFHWLKRSAVHLQQINQVFVPINFTFNLWQTQVEKVYSQLRNSSECIFIVDLH